MSEFESPPEKRENPIDTNLAPIKEEELRRKLAPLLELVQEDKRSGVLEGLVLSVTTITQRYHSGPLPSPEQLEEYAKLIPNGADRIMNMAEKQMEHRQNLENNVISSQLKQSRLGQWLGFAIGVITITCGAGCVLLDHDIAGLILGGAGLTGLVSVFVIGKKQQRDDLEEKH